jgi:ferredoxin-NADP reductase
VQFSTRVGAAPSTFKQALCALQPGDRVEAIGPFGEFLVEDASPVVFLAGGIGITPFRAMLLDLSARAERRPTTLLYSNSTPNIPFRDAFDSLTAGWPELELVYTVTRPSAGWHGPSGRIDAGLISQYVPDLSRSRFFVCGPAAFVEAVVGALHDLGVPAARITQEDFPGYEPAAEPSQAAA